MNDSGALRHDALLYSDDQQYLDGVLPFVLDAVRAEQPVFVAVPAERVALLRDQLDGAESAVRFADMTQLGRNPNRIIPAVAEFLAAHSNRTVRFVGEPIWSGRTRAEIEEATRHEALLNVAFADADARVLCPYDAVALDPAVLADAELTHPELVDASRRWRSTRYTDPVALCAAANWELPPPRADAVPVEYPIQHLDQARNLARDEAQAAGLDADRIDDVLLAVNELCTNTLRYSVTGGTLRIWHEPYELICEVRDDGHIRDPLAGRRTMPADAPRGRGLYLVNHLADLVQLRSAKDGTTVRLRFSR